jgi:16S rRNA (uracil1498-N3)-methyltransferase
MNLLLLQKTEVDGSRVTLSGRRAEHLLRVLRVSIGQVVRAAVVGLGTCDATVETLDSQSVVLSLGEILPAERPRVSVVLALPRPKALSRIVAAASSFGLKRLVLINAWRVERSYFSSPKMAPERLAEDALLGAEQGKQVWLPEITVVPSFRQFVEDLDPVWFPREGARKMALHPGSALHLGDVLGERIPASVAREESLVLGIGPEGGFIDMELQSLKMAGYVLTRLDTGPLRTEIAVAAALGQLCLLRPPANP